MARRDRGNYLLKRKRGSLQETPVAAPLFGTQWFIDQKHPSERIVMATVLKPTVWIGKDG